jgi:NAD(P)-dependent dehydrogenase (short-subunit alcohol dehydrogenase family)
MLLDRRDVGSVERLRDVTLDRFGSVDFVINNAGGQFTASPFAITDNGWRAVVDLNLNGTWNMCNRFGCSPPRGGKGRRWIRLRGQPLPARPARCWR